MLRLTTLWYREHSVLAVFSFIQILARYRSLRMESFEYRHLLMAKQVFRLDLKGLMEHLLVLTVKKVHHSPLNQYCCNQLLAHRYRGQRCQRQHLKSQRQRASP